MSTRLQIVSVLLAVGGFVLVFELVRRKRLMERYALLWLASTLLLLVLSLWTDALNWAATQAGVRYGPSALFAVILGAVLLLLLHFSLVISRLSDQNKVLAQRLGLLQQRVDEVAGDGPGGPDAAAEPSERERVGTAG